MSRSAFTVYRPVRLSGTLRNGSAITNLLLRGR